jgi:CRISPR-associated endonuclease/helicase Cas3
MALQSPSKFADTVRAATRGLAPYPYQQRLADEGLPDVLRAPTGAGKTLAAVLPWLYRRREHPDAAVRAATPRWLVIVLPQRALVEQTVGVIEGWLTNLGAERDVGLHTLMGGVDRDDRRWKSEPARDRIFVGTQDMVLSRLLMRGFAELRSGWPMSFGLLHSGAQFVFDEVQLMGPALPTSLQLQGLREVLGTAVQCHSMWMSATLDPAGLSTPDLRRALAVVELGDEDRHGVLRRRLDATRTVTPLQVDGKNYARELAAHVLAQHRPGTRTLAVLNTVDRASAVYAQLYKAAPSAETVLLHSRFRPGDRRRNTENALAEPGVHGSIVVATQVLEAGVDVTSDTLITELAPWSSIVQRAGRCNRDGLATDARLLWTPPPEGRGAERPYPAEELSHSAAVLGELEGRPVTSGGLQAAGHDVTAPVHPVLRRRDLLDLFDTAPDLGGDDIDVSPFIRDGDERTSMVAWRDLDEPDQPFPGREELCPAPIPAVRELIKTRRARILDQSVGEWRPAQQDDVRPSSVIVLDRTAGGYTTATGFDRSSTAPVEPVAATSDTPDAVDIDPHSVGSGRWVPLDEHLADVERETRKLLADLGELPGLDVRQREAAALAGRYHDLGKAHPTFIASLQQANTAHPPPGDGPWAKSPGRAPLRHDPKHFRHELVSALLLVDASTGLLDGVPEADLVTYLVLAHHGKVRLTVRGRPDEPADRILGVVEGKSTMAATLPDGTAVAARQVTLWAIRFGDGSLTSRALRLRDRSDLGPFRLAFLEAVVRSADWRASQSYEGERP